MKRYIQKTLESEQMKKMKSQIQQILWLFTIAWLTILTLAYFLR